MKKEAEIAVDALHELLDKILDAEASVDEKLGKMFSPELATAILSMFMTNYKRLLKESAPLLAMFDATVGDGEILASMMASFTQGLFMGHHIGTQKDPLTYCDDIVGKYCAENGVDFKEVIDSTFDED